MNSGFPDRRDVPASSHHQTDIGVDIVIFGVIGKAMFLGGSVELGDDFGIGGSGLGLVVALRQFGENRLDIRLGRKNVVDLLVGKGNFLLRFLGRASRCVLRKGGAGRRGERQGRHA